MGLPERVSRGTLIGEEASARGRSRRGDLDRVMLGLRLG